MTNHHISNPEAATDEPAFISTLASDALGDGADEARRCRHDGWTPERMTGFIRALAACGVVADACRQVGMSAQSAYALRNRRAGRAFATAWDAVLVHRARTRLADELMSRSMNGCVERVERDGVVAERRRFDNRLSMAMLTRLDRMAEKAEGEAQVLRAVSEDLDDLLDCIEQGGDADAFIEQRTPDDARPLPSQTPRPLPVNQSPPDEFDRLARIAGCSDWRDVHPFDVPVDDLDPDRTEDWDLDAWVRAARSGYLAWLAMFDENEEWDEDGEDHERPFGDECAEAFDRARDEVRELICARDTGYPESSEGEPPAAPGQYSTSSTSCGAQDSPQHDDVSPPIGDCADAISL